MGFHATSFFNSQLSPSQPYSLNCGAKKDGESMDRLIRFFRTVTWLGFLGALVWSYAYIPDEIAYTLNSKNQPSAFASKEDFFFISLTVFILVNVVCITFAGTLKKVKTQENGVGIRNRSLKLDIITWIHGFSGMVNLFFSLLLLFIGYINGVQAYQVKGFGSMIYIGPVMIIGWLVYLFVLLGKKRN